MESKDITFQQFLEYNSALYYNEISFNSLFNKSDAQINEYGYLIFLKDFEELKENLKYSLYKEYNTSYPNHPNKLKGLFGQKDFIKLKKLKQIEFKTSKYLKRMLMNGNKYTLICPNLWNKLSDNKNNINNEEAILFLISGSKINLFFGNNDVLELININLFPFINILFIYLDVLNLICFNFFIFVNSF